MQTPMLSCYFINRHVLFRLHFLGLCYAVRQSGGGVVFWATSSTPHFILDNVKSVFFFF